MRNSRNRSDGLYDAQGFHTARSSHYMTPAVERVLNANERRRDRRLRTFTAAMILLAAAAAIAVYLNW